MEHEIKKLVRLANTDIMGDRTVLHGLKKVYGVGLGFSNAVCQKLNVEKTQQIGALPEEKIREIEQAILDPASKGIPSWLYNRKFDLETGNDIHITGPKLKLTKEFDIRRMKKIKSYRGVRHMHGLPLRGQRTQGNFRKGKIVGVVKRKPQQVKKKK